MKDKIVKLADGMEYCIVEEVINNNRKFCLAYEVNTKEDVVYNRFSILEEKLLNGNVVLDGVDGNERLEIAELLIEAIRNNIKESN